MNAISGASAATATPAATQSAHPDPALDERGVVFRGDGEPKTPGGIVRRLAELEAESALSPDNYSLGGSVEALERHFAGLLGTEAAIFMPTGTLANHLAIRRHCGTRPRAIVQEQSHLYHDSGDCVTRLSAINLVPLAPGRPHFTADELDEALGASTGGRVLNEVGAVMIESPVRRQSGRVVPIDVMRQLTQLCRERGIPTHLDGARLFMMAGATGIRAADYAALFDTTYVSLYKYFGAHFGAILCGTADFVDGLYHERRLFGGGLPASYFAAALALSGSRGFEERFGAAMDKAVRLFEELNTLSGISVGRFENGSNIFPVDFDDGVDAHLVAERLAGRGVFVYPQEGQQDSFTLTVNTTILRQSNDEIVGAFSAALG